MYHTVCSTISDNLKIGWPKHGLLEHRKGACLQLCYDVWGLDVDLQGHVCLLLGYIEIVGNMSFVPGLGTLLTDSLVDAFSIQCIVLYAIWHEKSCCRVHTKVSDCLC